MWISEYLSQDLRKRTTPMLPRRLRMSTEIENYSGSCLCTNGRRYRCLREIVSNNASRRLTGCWLLGRQQPTNLNRDVRHVWCIEDQKTSYQRQTIRLKAGTKVLMESNINEYRPTHSPAAAAAVLPNHLEVHWISSKKTGSLEGISFWSPITTSREEVC